MGYVVRPVTHQILIFQENLSGVRFINSADHVEDGGFTTSVRPDDREYLIVLNLEAHAFYSFNSTEGNT
jgi:hypothetical protein